MPAASFSQSTSTPSRPSPQAPALGKSFESMSISKKRKKANLYKRLMDKGARLLEKSCAVVRQEVDFEERYRVRPVYITITLPPITVTQPPPPPIEPKPKAETKEEPDTKEEPETKEPVSEPSSPLAGPPPHVAPLKRESDLEPCSDPKPGAVPETPDVEMDASEPDPPPVMLSPDQPLPQCMPFTKPPTPIRIVPAEHVAPSMPTPIRIVPDEPVAPSMPTPPTPIRIVPDEPVAPSMPTVEAEEPMDESPLRVRHHSKLQPPQYVHMGEVRQHPGQENMQPAQTLIQPSQFCQPAEMPKQLPERRKSLIRARRSRKNAPVREAPPLEPDCCDMVIESANDTASMEPEFSGPPQARLRSASMGFTGADHVEASVQLLEETVQFPSVGNDCSGTPIFPFRQSSITAGAPPPQPYPQPFTVSGTPVFSLGRQSTPTDRRTSRHRRRH